MKGNSNLSLSDNENINTKDILNNKQYPKVTFNLLEDKSHIKDFDKKIKQSMLTSNSRSKKFINKVNSLSADNDNNINNNNENPNKLMRQLSKTNLTIDGVQIPKSSLNIQKNLLATKSFISNSKITKTKSHYESKNNNNNNPHKRSKLEQTKNNFLKLITKTNEKNYEKEYNNSRYSLLYGKNFCEVFEGDDLTQVEQKLKSKIIDMGKEAEFMEFEIGPLDISIDRFNIKKKKKRIITKRTKDLERRKYEKNKKFIKTAINKKHMFSQISSSNSNNLNSENMILNRSNQYLDDSSKITLSDKKKISSNVNFSSKVKFSSSSNKKSKSEKGSNNIASNFKRSYNNSNFINSKMNSKVNSKMNSKANSKLNSRVNSKVNSKAKSKVNQKPNLYDKLTHIFKTRSLQNNPQKNETLINKSKTYSDLGSKIGQTLISNTEGYDKINSLISEKEVIVIDKEKFRILTHKKLVYDSLDDEELIEDAVIDNFYFNPKSNLVIIIDTLVLIFTFWSILYKPLYIVLNNCDIQNTITSITFDNISSLFMDILFIADLIINFFKAYYNFDEQLITKSNQIFLHYLKGYFAIDLISAIPYYSIIKFIALNRYLKYGAATNCSHFYNHKISDAFQIIELLKLIKIIKCISRTNVATNYIISILNALSFFENWSYLIFNICFSFLLLHLTACIHIFISSTAYPSWIIQKNLNFSHFSNIYLTSIYFLMTTVTSVGYGDIIGNSFTEFCFQIVILLVGIIAYSWLISSLSNYVKENNKQSEMFDKKLSLLNEIKLEHPNLTKELYDKIYLHFINNKQKKDKNSLIDSLPHTVKKELLNEMYKPIIDNFNFFKNFKNSDFINRVISKLKPVIAVKNDFVLDQGEIMEETFFVKQGRLSLEVKIDAIHPEKSVQKLLDEEYFFGVENNKLYKKNAFGFASMTTIKQTVYPTSINQKNLYNLYSRTNINMNNVNQKEVKSILTNDQGKGEIQKHQKTISNYIYLKILDIRKNEHFGALLMFLNKRSPLSLRVKTKKAELFFLKKIDAIEISSSYPNIWKRVNKASFHNLKQIKKIMHRIIIHFCETYGINFMKKICKESSIKDMEDLKKIYTIQNKISKDYYKDNKFTTINNNQNNSHRLSALVNKSQLRMLKEFINTNTIKASKPYEEKQIEQAEIKDLDINGDIKKEKVNAKDFSVSKKINPSFSNDEQMNCTLDFIKIKNKNKKMSSKKENALLLVDEDKNRSKNENLKNKVLSEESIETRTKEELNIESKNKKTNYGKEKIKKLIQNYGTPYFPEDINDEIYPQEVQKINSKIINKNNNYIEEKEYMPINYLLSSQDSIKNNYIQTIKEININGLNEDKTQLKNVTINNNFITNNVINNIQNLKIKNKLTTFHFGFNFKSKNNESSIISKKDKGDNNLYNFAIFKNSFELSAYKNDEKIDFDIKNELEEKKKDKKESKKSKIDKNENKLLNNNIINKDSFSSSSSSSNSFSSKDENKKCNKSLKDEKPEQKIINFQSSSFSTIKQKETMDKGYKIFSNKGVELKAEYFNLNQITNGKFSKNKGFQEHIKNIIIKKLSDLNHSRIELPEITHLINSNRSPLPNNKKKISKKYSAFLPFQNWRNDKVKNSINKNQRSNFMASELNDRGKDTNLSKKKIYRKSNNNVMLLNYINRNIRDDSAVLNNPGKFYNGLFNDIMKKYTKVNNIKQFQK